MQHSTTGPDSGAKRTHRRLWRLGLVILMTFTLAACRVSKSDMTLLRREINAGENRQILKQTNLARVWSGHPVGFSLLTTDKFQYAAFYDSARRMCIAQRELTGDHWTIQTLPSVTGWDSHNYIALARDKDGYLHISGNMHAVPLVYFRSRKPDDIGGFEQLPMTGKNESHVTYPVFFKDAQGNLFFQYRQGGSGNGTTLWNRYDTRTRQWTQVFDKGLFDGEGEANAYSSNPTLGPDGYVYIAYMWRATPIANTNHNLSCIRSRDLIHWENLKGEPLALPVRWRDASAFADPTGPWNGMINSNFTLSWDNHGRPCLTYHKYDQQGNSQIFVARLESSRWKIYQLSSWTGFRWNIDEGGSLGRQVGNVTLKPIGDGKLIANYYNAHVGRGVWLIDEGNFHILKTLADQALSELPASLTNQKPDVEGMQINRATDNTGNYLLEWESLPVNRDRPRNPPYPAPTWLKMIQLSARGANSGSL